ncbi:P-II family nitrogen regulator [Sulfurihydrogenibium azorense]|uniref:P-II family nitrogen regulator n=1 Tax=Sulfurihydrogenibium azorense TaxID=309806 RepID=UPI00391CCBA4
MKLVKAVIRPEKLYDVMKALEKDGFKGITVMDVVGRGQEGGIQVGDKSYDELAKTLIMIAVEDKHVEKVIEIITKHANTGMFGDGKIFVCHLEEVWTIRTKKKEIEVI